MYLPYQSDVSCTQLRLNYFEDTLDFFQGCSIYNTYSLGSELYRLCIYFPVFF